jgi:hypothetical protein
MCLRNEEQSTPRPTEPDVAAPHQKSPAKQPNIPVKEPVDPDRRLAHRPLAAPWLCYS